METQKEFSPKRRPAPTPPRQLIEEIEAHNVIPFIGAGLSMAARVWKNESPNMPGYHELLERLLALSGINQEKCKIIEIWLGTGDDDKAARELRDAMGAFPFYRGIRSILQPPDIRIEPSPAHRFLKALDFHCLITTNYDRLLEQFVGQEHEVITPRDLQTFILFSTDAYKKSILKLHGDISRPETIPFGHEDLRELYQSKSDETNHLRRFLEDKFSKNTILFLGCSLAESEGFVQLLEELVRSTQVGPIRKHYALVPHDKQYESLRKSLTQRMGIEFLEYYPDESHSQVWEFIASLNMGKKSEPRDGYEWDQWYLFSQRAEYLERQLELEKTALAVRFIHPMFTNAIATDFHLDQISRKTLKSKISQESQREEMEQYIDEKIIPAMFARRDNLLERLRQKNLEVEILFLKTELEKSLVEPDQTTMDRYHLLLELMQTTKIRVRLILDFTAEQLKDLEANYGLIIRGTPKPDVDIALAYASQATSDYFEVHTIQINTLEVIEKVAQFEKFWASSWNEEKSEEYIRNLVERK